MSKLMSRRVGVLLSLSLGVGAAFVSGPTSAAEVWVTDYIKTVYPLSDGTFVIIFVNSQPSCTNDPTAPYFYVSPGHNNVNVDGAKALLSTSLTAFALGRRISLAFEASTSYCYVNRLQIAG